MIYTAACERVGDWWEITVPELPSGRVTQARELADVDETVKDLVSLMTGADPADVEVRVKVIDPPGRAHDHTHAPLIGIAALLAGFAAAAGALRRVMQGR